MRVGIIALLHESNTFVEGRTTREAFLQDMFLRGDAVTEQLAGSHHEVGGFIEGLAAAGITIAPILAARAVPSGPIADGAFQWLCAEVWRELERTGPLDGILVAPHGAAVGETCDDADGQWLGELRLRVGPKLPIIGTLDLHANLSPAMVEATTALVAYRTNPHLDQRARGVEAASLMARTLAGEIRPVQAAAFPPMAMAIDRQGTDEDPCRSILLEAQRQRRLPGVLSHSVVLGFPYADVAEMGASTLVVTDGDPYLAARLADELAQTLWQARGQCVSAGLQIAEAVRRAGPLDGPVCLLDMGDNIGGGSAADGTLLAQALVDAQLMPAFVCLWDPAAVVDAQSAGAGHRIKLTMGGKTSPDYGKPLEADATVVALFSGRFRETEPRHGGAVEMDQGKTAVVRTDQGLTVMLTSLRMPPFSLGQLTAHGVEPRAYQAIVAKGVNAPLAAYRPVCRHFIRVDTPGATAADVTRFRYQKRRRPMFPFEPCEYDARGTRNNQSWPPGRRSPNRT